MEDSPCTTTQAVDGGAGVKPRFTPLVVTVLASQKNTTHERTHRFEFSGGHDILWHLSMLHRAPTLETETETLTRFAAIGTQTIDTWLVACATDG